MQKKSELPEGWVRTTLDFITHEIVRGPFGSALKKSFFVPSGYKVYEQKNVIYQDFSLGNYYVDEAKFQELKRFEIKPRDVLISCSGTVGKIVIVPNEIEPGIINQALLKLSINENVLFLPYFTRLFEFKVQGIVADNTRGSAMLNLSSVKDLKTVPFEIPPLSEQHRIVSSIEALLARLDATNEKLEKMPEILKRFRQSVLAAACDGRLTEEWRLNRNISFSIEDMYIQIQKQKDEWYHIKYLNAKESNLRIPKNPDRNKKSTKPVIDLPDLPDTWNYFRMEETSYLITDGTHKTPAYVENGTPFLSVKNVRPFKIKDEDIKFITTSEHEQLIDRCNPQKGDILYTKIGATYGYAAEVNLDYSFSIFVSLALIKPVNPYFSSKYAEVVLNSPIIYAQAKDRVSGIGTPDLHLIEIRDFRIPLPPLPEQQEIVRRVNALFAFADSIEAKVAAAREKTEKLMQSILAKAFSGKLVETEAEIARRECRDYETAEVLLEKIKAEKRKVEKGKSKRK